MIEKYCVVFVGLARRYGDNVTARLGNTFELGNISSVDPTLEFQWVASHRVRCKQLKNVTCCRSHGHAISDSVYASIP